MAKPQTIAKLTITYQTDRGGLIVSTEGTRAAAGSKLVHYRLDWGDGSAVEGDIPGGSYKHDYEYGGTYTVLLTVKDSKGKSAQGNVMPMMIVRPVPPIPPPSGSLLQRENLVYLGGFRFPAIDGYSFYTRGLAYNAANNSLFTGGGFGGATIDEKVSEISIPAIITPDYTSMQFASVLQSPADATEGNDYHIGAGGADLAPTGVTIHRGGLLVYNNKLIGTAYVEYDASVPPAAQLSHWKSGLNLSTLGDFQGAYQVGSLGAAFVDGYMCDITAAWQARLGGPCLTGMGALAVISRTSYGPGLHVFDPDALSGPTGSSFPATPLVYYPDAHQTLGRWDNLFPDDPAAHTNFYFNSACMYAGACFPVGYDTVLVFGNVGYGIPGYGAGTCDPLLDHTLVGPAEPGVYYILDKYQQSKGSHSWPYKNQIWAYDANELYAVKQGTKQPWEVIPYAIWDITADLPIHDGDCIDTSFGAGIQAAAYDPSTKRIFLVQGEGAEHWCPTFPAFSFNPLIRVYQVTP